MTLRMSLAWAVQTNGFWILIVRGDTFLDGRNQFGNASEGAALQVIRREAAEEALDRVELEADVGVKWTWRRGCLSSHSVTLGATRDERAVERAHRRELGCVDNHESQMKAAVRATKEAKRSASLS